MAIGDKQKCVALLKSNLLVTLTLFGAIIGFTIGFAVRSLQPTKDALMWIGMPGELYLNTIKMMIVPLISSSIISGTSSLDPKSNGKISMVGLAFILATNFIGTLLGAILCVFINPGGRATDANASQLKEVNIQTEDVFADLLRNLLPENLVASTFQVTITKYVTDKHFKNITDSNGTYSEEMVTFIKDKYLGKGSTTNMLGLLIISLLFGMATSAAGKSGRPFLKFFRAATDIVLLLLDKLLWSTPIGVASLIMKVVAGAADIGESFTKVGMYIGTFMLGLAIALFILHPLIYFIIVRKNPLKFMASLTEPMLIVLATTLTTIAMPLSLVKLENEPNNVDRRVTRFIVPLCAAIGRTGSCIFLSASCVFISQLESQDQNPASIVLIIVLITMMSLAVPSIPSGALVTIIVLLSAIGISPEAASLLFAFDWFSDRMRSIVNIYFQCLTSAVTDKLCESTLKNTPHEDTEMDFDVQLEDITTIPMLNHNGQENAPEKELDEKHALV